MTVKYDVVVPTIGRPELPALLAALEGAAVPRPRRIVVVDDRRNPGAPLVPDRAAPGLEDLLRVVRSGGRGPAAARNVGWRACSSEWIVFLDDDVVPTPDWGRWLVGDLASAPAEVAGVQGHIDVPLPAGRAPTDWERNVAGLASSRWITADMAYRRSALWAVGGFDERFPRPYREDADLALRMVAHGLSLTSGRRRTVHPARDARPLDSVRRQAGNADDALMTVLHGRDWRHAAGAGQGRRPWHLLTVSAAFLALRRALRPGGGRSTPIPALAWVGLTLDFAWRRLQGGPWSPAEVATMLATSVLIPPAATWHWLAGWARALRLMRRPPVALGPADVLPAPTEAVLFDRDGTLVADVPYNGDPDLVVPMPHAREILDALRGRGVRVGLVTNQSGIARGLLTTGQVEAVNARIGELLGPFDTVVVCPHHPDDRCACRKPEPGLVTEAARRLGVDVTRCVVIGDIGSDIEAARRAGAGGILVPTGATLPVEVAAVPWMAADLAAALDLLAPSLADAA